MNIEKGDLEWVATVESCVTNACDSSDGRLAVSGRTPVFFDSGIRRGQHILKAYALGADLVFLGRSALYGVCANGADGARLALTALMDELTRAMQLCGVHSLREASALVAMPAQQPTFLLENT